MQPHKGGAIAPRAIWVVLTVLLASMLSCNAALASTSKANPQWSMGDASSSASPLPQSNSPAATWECEGVAFTPGIVKDPQGAQYVHFSAKQSCFLEFGSQQVCTSLEEYIGEDFHQISTFKCTATTTGVTVTANGTVACSLTGHGVYRSVGEGYAYPEGQKNFSGEHYSATATLC